MRQKDVCAKIIKDMPNHMILGSTRYDVITEKWSNGTLKVSFVGYVEDDGEFHHSKIFHFFYENGQWEVSTASEHVDIIPADHVVEAYEKIQEIS